MHNVTKRSIALLLALVMLLGSLPALSLMSVAEESDNLTATDKNTDYDYSSIYVQEGLAFFWSGFDLREGDSPLTALENDHDYLTANGVFPEALIKNFIKSKREECKQMAAIPHPAEYDKYFNL